MSKCDPELGLKIQQYLQEKGIESPINYDAYHSRSADNKVKAIEKHVRASLEILGFDLSNDSVQDTPKRVANMWVKEVMSGLDYHNFPRVMTFENKFQSSGMVIERDVKSMSLCSHHLVTIDGTAFVAYIPNKKIVGLSKINRIVDYFSRRPQEAERLTLQIYHALEYILGTEDIAVFLTGTHYCVKARGASDLNSSTSTVKLGGVFMSDSMLRQEFYAIVNSK